MKNKQTRVTDNTGRRQHYTENSRVDEYHCKHQRYYNGWQNDRKILVVYFLLVIKVKSDSFTIKNQIDISSLYVQNKMAFINYKVVYTCNTSLRCWYIILNVPVQLFSSYHPSLQLYLPDDSISKTRIKVRVRWAALINGQHELSLNSPNI